MPFRNLNEEHTVITITVKRKKAGSSRELLGM